MDMSMRRRLVHSGPTRSVFTTCTATFGSGSRIVGTATIKVLRRTGRHGPQVAQRTTVCCAGAPGTSVHRTSAQPTASGSLRTTASGSTVSVWPGRYNLSFYPSHPYAYEGPVVAVTWFPGAEALPRSMLALIDKGPERFTHPAAWRRSS